MLLSVRERLILSSILPQEGDFVTLKILRNLQSALGFDEDEHKLYKFLQNEGRVTWDDKGEQNKEIEIGEKANDIIVRALSELSERKKLQMEHFDIYTKFVGE